MLYEIEIFYLRYKLLKRFTFRLYKTLQLHTISPRKFSMWIQLHENRIGVECKFATLVTSDDKDIACYIALTTVKHSAVK